RDRFALVRRGGLGYPKTKTNGECKTVTIVAEGVLLSMFCTGPDCRQNRQLIFSPKIQYKLPAERATLCVRTDALGSEAVASGLSFSLVWTLPDSNR
ncbi:MAG: hypothetical protein UY59_C0017G0001, partial [Candidatus Kaiserbacteria bacterium GW2011_GWA1_50_28]